VHAFYVAGGCLALWALILSGLGIVSDRFPSSAGIERAVAAITVLLVGGAIATAIIDASNEKTTGNDAGKSAAALLP
jgi:hypothetical protein